MRFCTDAVQLAFAVEGGRGALADALGWWKPLQQQSLKIPLLRSTSAAKADHVVSPRTLTVYAERLTEESLAGDQAVRDDDRDRVEDLNSGPGEPALPPQAPRKSDQVPHLEGTCIAGQTERVLLSSRGSCETHHRVGRSVTSGRESHNVP